MQRLTTKLQGGTDAFCMPLVIIYDLDLQTAQGRIKAKCTLGRLEDILYTPDGTERITLDRLAELVDAERDGRVVVLPCKVEPFDCQHCKHLSPSDKTNRLFCSYHSEGEHQYEVYRDDYCSDFERAEAEAKGERE